MMQDSKLGHKLVLFEKLENSEIFDNSTEEDEEKHNCDFRENC